MIKLLYICGWGRSGSTILERILGEVEGFTPLGEMRYIWDRNLIEDQPCGCGKPFSQCREWREIIKRAYGEPLGIDPYRMIHHRSQFARTLYLPTLFLPGATQWNLDNHRSYFEALDALYHAIWEHFGSRVLIDSSKHPAYAYTLDLIPSLDVYLVHLVRDPRAVAFSWQRGKLQPIGRCRESGDRRQEFKIQSTDPKAQNPEPKSQRLEPMIKFNSTYSTLLWTSWNLAAELFWRKKQHHYLFQKYEDFIINPLKAVKRILDFIEVKPEKMPFVDDYTVELGITHTVSGNPNRRQIGIVPLRQDDEWRRSIQIKDKLIATALSLPLLLRYGYPLFISK